MDETAGEIPIGVATNTQATVGGVVTVALVGSIAMCANASQTTIIDAGCWVETNDNAVKGTVSEYTPRAALASTVIDGSNDTTIDEIHHIVGVALKDIAVSSYGPVLLMPHLALPSDHAVVT
jgi:hypothetical protein